MKEIQKLTSRLSWDSKTNLSHFNYVLLLTTELLKLLEFGAARE